MEEDKQQETTTSTVAGRPGIRPVTGLRFSSLVYMHCLQAGRPIVKRRSQPTRAQVNRLDQWGGRSGKEEQVAWVECGGGGFCLRRTHSHSCRQTSSKQLLHGCWKFCVGTNSCKYQKSIFSLKWSLGSCVVEGFVCVSLTHTLASSQQLLHAWAREQITTSAQLLEVLRLNQFMQMLKNLVFSHWSDHLGWEWKWEWKLSRDTFYRMDESDDNEEEAKGVIRIKVRVFSMKVIV